MSEIIQSFWYGDSLSDIELLCLNSFLKNKFTYHLYSYNNIKNIPGGIVVKDANEILEIKHFRKCNKYGNIYGDSWNYGSFSDMFRYRLLYLKGGWWHDTDSCCVKKFSIEQEYVFTKHYEANDYSTICNGIIKAPEKSKLFESCFNEAYRLFKLTNGQIQWSWLGPRLLNKKIIEHGLESVPTYEPVYFCPIRYWETQKYFFSTNYVINKQTYCIHFYTSAWRNKEKYISKYPLFIRNNSKILINRLYHKYVNSP